MLAAMQNFVIKESFFEWLMVHGENVLISVAAVIFGVASIAWSIVGKEFYYASIGGRRLGRAPGWYMRPLLFIVGALLIWIGVGLLRHDFR